MRLRLTMARQRGLFYLGLGLSLGWSASIAHDYDYLTSRHLSQLVLMNLVFYGAVFFYRDLAAYGPAWARVLRLLLTASTALGGIFLAARLWAPGASAPPSALVSFALFYSTFFLLISMFMLSPLRLRFPLLTLGAALLLSFTLTACGEDEKEDDPQPTTQVYALRYTLTTPAARPSTLWAGVDVDVAPYHEVSQANSPGDVYLVGDDIPTNQPVTRTLSPEEYQGKKTRVRLSFMFPETTYQLQPGDAIKVELLGDNKVLHELQLDYANFRAQSENTYQSNGKIDYSKRSVEVTLP